VLRGKEPLDRAGLEALAGEFSNGLLHQVVRMRLAKRTGAVREMIVGRALLSAQPGAGLTDEDPYGAPMDGVDPLADDELDDYLDDPLGIAVPWEEKYGATAGDAPSQGSAEGAGAQDDGSAADNGDTND